MSNDIDSPSYLKLVSDAFLATACTTSHGTAPDGTEYESLDSYGGKGWHESAVVKAIQLCTKFISLAKEDLLAADLDPHQVGQDFWLTAAGHGAGFWDRGLGIVGDRLTKHCKATVGHEPEVYIGDDTYLYLENA